MGKVAAAPSGLGADQLFAEQFLDAEQLLAERLLDAEQLLAEQLLAEQLLDAKQLLEEKLLTEQLLLRLTETSSHVHITERVLYFEQIELQAKLLNYFLGSNKSNINQSQK